MSIVTCSVNEQGAVVDTYPVGFTNVLQTTGVARNAMLLTVALTLASTGGATSALYPSYERDVVESATAVSSTPSKFVGGINVAVSATAKTFLLNQPVSYAVSSGAAASTTVVSITTQATSIGAAVDALTTGRQSASTVSSSAAAQGTLFGFTDLVLASQANATSSAILSATGNLVASDSGIASSFAATGVGTAATAISTGVGQSFYSGNLVATSSVSSTGNASNDVFSALPQLREAWVINTESAAMSRYAGLPVGSMAVLGSRILALGDGGLYEFMGSTDDGTPIVTSVKTGRSMLGVDSLKRLGDIVISYVCAGVMTVRVGAYGGAISGTFDYDMPPRSADAPRSNRLQVGKGLVSRYFQFEFVGKNGAQFDVDSATADVIPSSTRRI